MRVNERVVSDSMSDDVVQPSDVGWFAAKQPGLLRFLEDRLGGEADALALAVNLCWRIVAAFEEQRGLPLGRLEASELERAEVEVVAESRGQLELANGCAHRQPELCRWLEAALAAPLLPIDRVVLDQVALSAAACISACDRAHRPHTAGAEPGPSSPILVG
jgi:hypothetical protein